MSNTPEWVLHEDSISRQWTLKAGHRTLGPFVWFNSRTQKYMGQTEPGRKIHSFDTLKEAHAVLAARWRLNA